MNKEELLKLVSKVNSVCTHHKHILNFFSVCYGINCNKKLHSSNIIQCLDSIFKQKFEERKKKKEVNFTDQ